MKQRWIGLALSLALLAACEGGNRSVGPASTPPGGPAETEDSKPTSTPAELGILADVRGWIAYGNDEGIWAVNPTPGGTPSDRIQLSEHPGEPVAWSNDGSKLLFSREVPDAPRDPTADRDLYVLNADGTETRLTWDHGWPTGSISPDGSEVVYDAWAAEWNSGIYVVRADGGSHRLLLAAGKRAYPDGTYRTALFIPTFSPDGTQIAYFDGLGDWGNSLRVVNADGSGPRAIVDCRWNQECPPQHEYQFSHVENLAWSPDGSHLAFNNTGGGIWIVGADGSGLTKVDGKDVRWSPTGSRLAFQSGSPSSTGLWVSEGIWLVNADGTGLQQVAPVGRDPAWSPDGSRIAFLSRRGDSLYVADLNETHVLTLGTLEPHRHRPTGVVWNPLLSSAS
jgi:Tol biopolymer transport system component